MLTEAEATGSAEEIVSAGSGGPKATGPGRPSPINSYAEEDDTESRDVVDTPPANMTPSAARREFVFSPEMITVKEATTNDTEGCETTESPAPAESAATDDEKEEEAAAEVPEAEEVKEDKSAEELAEKEEEESAVPVKQEMDVIASLIEKATSYVVDASVCGTKCQDVVDASVCGTKWKCQDVADAVASLVPPTEEEPPTEMEDGTLTMQTEEVPSVQSSKSGGKSLAELISSAAEGVKTLKEDLGCQGQNEDLEMDLTETITEDAGLSKTVETVQTEQTAAQEEEQEEKEEPKEVEKEEPKEEEAPAAAPKPAKMSMKKRFSKKLKTMKKVLSFKTSKPEKVAVLQQ